MTEEHTPALRRL